MSRDLTPDLLDERAQRSQTGGADVPRGGRAGGSQRPRARPADVRDALTHQLNLPHTDVRERVEGHRYTLRGSEVRILAAVGAFRVADARDFGSKVSNDRWHGDLEHLRESRLIELHPYVLDGERTALVTLTNDGRQLLERHQQVPDGEAKQTFYSGLQKKRELSHDASLYSAYSRTAAQLHKDGARILRVVVDTELKREYQQFLQAANRNRSNSDGRPKRSQEEIREWAQAHGLPTHRNHVQFPDVRIEYERPDGTKDHEDIELSTGHYSSRQMAAKRASGFTMHHSTASRLRGAKSRKGGHPFDPHSAESTLR